MYIKSIEYGKEKCYKILTIKILIVLLSILCILSFVSCLTASPTGEICPGCIGSGKCNQCYGIGSISGEGKCRTCGGSGKCIACGGSGRYSRISVPGDNPFY